MTRTDRVAIAAAIGYLLVLGAAMQRVSYDYWGALIVMPVLALASAPLIRLAFPDDLAALRPFAWLGLIVKFAGAVVGYQIRFAAYGGAADAGHYHDAARLLAGDVHRGVASPFSVVPLGTSTAFVDELAGLVYTLMGSSRLGGFVVFAWMSYWGLVFYLKAAVTAIPGLASRRYALLLFLFPSLVYWGSSVGKEAVVGLFLGLAAYGAALMLTDQGRRHRGLLFTVFGLLVVSRVRPHYAAIWAGGVVVALVGRSVLDAVRLNEHGKRQFRLSTVALGGVGVVGFVLLVSATLRFLPDAAGDETAPVDDRLGSILGVVQQRTGQGGSRFQPVAITGLQSWPYAAFRTLSRPMIYEAHGLAALLPALEMTALVVAAMFAWRRFIHAPLLLLSRPYLVFATLSLFTFGVAFASIGNLGILVRQRSLALPLMLLFWCLPALSPSEVGTAPARTSTRRELTGQRSG